MKHNMENGICKVCGCRNWEQSKPCKTVRKPRTAKPKMDWNEWHWRKHREFDIQCD